MTLIYGLILGGTAQPPGEGAGKGAQEILELLLKPHRRGHPGRGDTSALTVLLMGKKRLWRRTPSGVGEQRAPSPNLCHELLPPAGPPHLCGRAKGEVRMAPLLFANSFENKQLCVCGKAVFILSKRAAARTSLPVFFSGKCQLALLERRASGPPGSCLPRHRLGFPA